MKSNIVLLDGASGTLLWNEAEKRGLKKKPVWMYNIEQPDMVAALAKNYAAAGSQIVYTNTFGANSLEVKRSSQYKCEDVVREGVRIAKEALKGTNCRIALSIGPLSLLMEPYGDLTEEEVEAIYQEMIGAGMDEGPDCIILETFIDLGMAVVAAKVAKRYDVPVYCTMSFEKSGRTIMGQSVKQVIEELQEVGVDGVGLNCSVGPVQALEVVKQFAENTDLPIIYKPNAGMPVLDADGTVISSYTAEQFAREVEPALEYVSFVGGCCGSDTTYISALRELLGR